LAIGVLDAAGIATGSPAWAIGGTEALDLDDLLRRPDWHAGASCKQQPEVNFFPELGEDAAPTKAVCATCPVVAECRSWAMDQGAGLPGIWGGTSRRERRRLRRG
jgi:WhiB family transcriptional regulator, redox-sensing transcriptional regulator